MQWVKATRTLFGYLQLDSLLETVRWLDAEGGLNKRYQTAKGQWRGGKGYGRNGRQGRSLQLDRARPEPESNREGCERTPERRAKSLCFYVEQPSLG